MNKKPKRLQIKSLLCSVYHFCYAGQSDAIGFPPGPMTHESYLTGKKNKIKRETKIFSKIFTIFRFLLFSALRAKLRINKKSSSSFKERLTLFNFHFCFKMFTILLFLKPLGIEAGINIYIKLIKRNFNSKKLTCFISCLFHAEFVPTLNQ